MKCEKCKVESGKYKYCSKCNEEYKKKQQSEGILTTLKNINQNIGHLVALLGKIYPKEEAELQKEWDEKYPQEKEEDEA